MENLIYATIDAVNGQPAVMTLTGHGHVQVYSLPSLKQLHSTQLMMNKCDMRWVVGCNVSEYHSYASTLCMSRQAHGVVQCTPSELQKFTLNAELAGTLSDVLGVLFQGVDMPEAPKPSVATTIISIFGGKNAAQLDREELCEFVELFLTFLAQVGEGSGKASRSIARHIPGPTSSSLDPTRAQGDSAAAAVARTRQV